MRTAKYTLDALETAGAAAEPDKRTGAAFVNLDTRVLKTLISDSRAYSDALVVLKDLLFCAEHGNGLEAHDRARDNARAALTRAGIETF